jgi:hypothetical protein
MKLFISGVAVLFFFGVAHTPLSAAEPATVNIEASKEKIDFLAGKELVGRYNVGPTVAKPYMWPLKGPGGTAITRSWPMDPNEAGATKDHPHQKSLWFCHGDVIPEGIELKSKPKGVAGVDFWSEGGGHGIIACTDVGTPKVDKSHGKIVTKNEWRTADGVKILDETRTLHLYDFGDTRLFVFDIDLLASVAPLTFGDTKEGSFGVRINDMIREAGGTGKGKLENADSKVNEKNIWGQKSPWCDYSGTLDGKVVGLAILDDPANNPTCCWHSRGYGLMAANPFGRDKSFPAMKGKTDLVKLAKGEHLKLRYGVLIHPGDAKDGKVADYYQRFVKLKE